MHSPVGLELAFTAAPKSMKGSSPDVSCLRYRWETPERLHHTSLPQDGARGVLRPPSLAFCSRNAAVRLRRYSFQSAPPSNGQNLKHQGKASLLSLLRLLKAEWRTVSRFKTWTLTDVANDVWLDSFSVGNDALRLTTPHDWSIRKRTLRGGLRDGIDLVEVHNGALSYSVLPTRGMGLWRGEYRGNYLGWRSPVQGPVHPHFVDLGGRDGLGWLTGFDEWLCRCGLASNGPPGEDVVTDKAGRSSRTRLTSARPNRQPPRPVRRSSRQPRPAARAERLWRSRRVGTLLAAASAHLQLHDGPRLEPAGRPRYRREPRRRPRRRCRCSIT